jgi:DNA-binding transcriptional ArsR family regulator
MKTRTRTFQVFGNKERVFILSCLAQKQTVSQLLSRSHLSQSALSQHLQILRNARVVHTSRAGKYRYYRVSNMRTLRLAQSLLTFSLSKS